MIKSLFAVLGVALSLWQSKEKRKYVDRFLKLEKEYYEQDNKDRPDMAILDNIEFDLQLLSHAVSAEIGKPNFTSAS